MAQGDLAQAQTFVAELLPHLEIEQLYGTRELFRIYLTCYLVLRAGQDPRAKEVLTTAYRLLHERAAETGVSLTGLYFTRDRRPVLTNHGRPVFTRQSRPRIPERIAPG